MTNFRWWQAIGLVAATFSTLTLTACGGGGSNSNASVRLANATITHPSIDLFVNGGASITATAVDTVSNYTSPSSGSVTLQVNDAGAGTALATTVPSLTGGNHYTLLAYEAGGAVRTAVLNEDFPIPSNGAAQFRIFDAATNAGRLDVYITDPAAPLNTGTSPTATFTNTTSNSASALLTYSPGTYRVRVTGAGNQADLRADIPGVVIAAGQVATIALTPSAGGTLINGSTLIQQGAYTASRNTNARVRLAAAVSGGATVSAVASNGAVIDGGSASPSFGFYTLVPATSTFSISVNGAAVAVPASVKLTQGADSTLLVYGAAASPTTSLIVDDNSAPSDATTTRLRLINGVTGSTGTLTLTANTAPVGINIPPGGSSTYVAVLGSTNPFNFVLSSSANGTFPPINTNILNPNTTYTVFAGGDISAPVLLIR